MTKKDRTARLQEAHRVHFNYNQAEPGDCRLMAELGHPHAADYRRLRAEFDTLKYACNSNTRFVAFRDDDNNVAVDAPDLSLTWYPKGIEGFYHVYPAHAGWEAYIRAAAGAGWPEGCGPALSVGRLSVRTTDARLVARLFVANEGGFKVDSANGPWDLRFEPRSAAHALACLAVVRRSFGRCVIEPRTAADDAADRGERPIPERTFRLANVDRVTLDPTSVLVPLIPADQTGQALAGRVANDLVDLCRSHGYPYAGAVRDWLNTFLTKSAMRDMDKVFGYKRPKLQNA